jgi:hypothetical protein
MIKRVFIIFLLSAFCYSLSKADGLSTSFADVMVPDVPLGNSWNIKNSKGSGLVLQNLGDQPILIHVKILIPQPSELRDHAEALPSVNWITIQPVDFELAPHSQEDCNVIFTIPSKRNFRGRLYQAMIFSRGVPVAKKGIGFNTGLLSRLRFKTVN